MAISSHALTDDVPTFLVIINKFYQTPPVDSVTESKGEELPNCDHVAIAAQTLACPWSSCDWLVTSFAEVTNEEVSNQCYTHLISLEISISKNCAVCHS